MFAFQNMPDTSGSSGARIDLFARPTFDLAPGLAARPFRVDNKTAKFDLTLYLAEVNEGMSVTWQFNTDLFDPSTIHRLAWQFQTLLEGIGDDPRKNLSELPLLSEAESRQARNRLEPHGNSASCRPGISSNCSRRRSSGRRTQWRCWAATATVHLSRSQRSGEPICPLFPTSWCWAMTTWTGVCLPRTPEMLAVLLGIWKAGGAFLPLDPDYPPERIAFKLRDRGRVAPCHANGPFAQSRLRDPVLGDRPKWASGTRMHRCKPNAVRG